MRMYIIMDLYYNNFIKIILSSSDLYLLDIHTESGNHKSVGVHSAVLVYSDILACNVNQQYQRFGQRFSHKL